MSTLPDHEALARHAKQLEALNRRPGTITQRRRVLGRLTRYLDGAPLLGVDIDDLRGYLEHRDQTATNGKGLSPTSRATEIDHLRGFYSWAFADELIPADPSARLPRPKRKRTLPRPIPDDALERALAGAPERIRPWLCLAAYAGLRACEIGPLRAEHINWTAEPPIIFIEVSKGGGMSSVPMAATLAGLLVDCALPTSGWLFPRRDGQDGPTPPWLVSQLSNKYLHEDLGIKDTLHSLRHWFGSSVYRASNRDLRLTQNLLRHQSPTSTAIYTYIDPGEEAAVVNLLGP